MPAHDTAFLAFFISTLLFLNMSANAFIGTIASPKTFCRDLSFCCMFGNKLFHISEIIVGGIRFLLIVKHNLGIIVNEKHSECVCISIAIWFIPEALHSSLSSSFLENNFLIYLIIVAVKNRWIKIFFFIFKFCLQ